MKNINILIFLLSSTLFIQSCSDDNDIVIPPANFMDCMEPEACNYNEMANINDDSCWYAVEECSCEDGEGAVFIPGVTDELYTYDAGSAEVAMTYVYDAGM